MLPDWTVYTLATDFLHLGYTGTMNRSSSGVIGLNSLGEIVRHENFSSRLTLDGGGKRMNVAKGKGQKIVNVIADNFIGKGTSYFVVLKDETSFSAALYHDDKKVLETPKSPASPMIVTDPENLSQLIVMTVNNRTVFYSIVQNTSSGQYELKEHNKYGLSLSLHPQHTSAFVDVTGDLRPNLVLMSSKGAERYLNIYDFKSPSDGPKLVQGIKIADKTGPTLFLDIRGQKCFDMVYVSMENNEHYLNIHYNLSPPVTTFDNEKFLKKRDEVFDYFSNISPTRVFEATPSLKVKLQSIWPNTKPVICDENGMPTGIFVTDFSGEGQMAIMVTLEEKGTKFIQGIYIEDNEVKEVPYNEKLKESFKDVISVSAFDVVFEGTPDLIVNCYDMQSPSLKGMSIVSKNKNANLKLSCLRSLTPVTSERQRHELVRAVYGATYLIYYCFSAENQYRLLKCSQHPHTSYPSFQTDRVYVGLGDVKKYFIQYVIVSTNYSQPSTGMKSYAVKADIPPNTLVVFAAEGSKWHLMAIFSSTHYKNVFASLVVFIIANGIALLVIYMRNRKRNEKEMRDKATFGPLFAAL